jgi:hypothetical protein
MPGKPQKYSLRSILKAAYDQNKLTSNETFFDYTEYYDKFYRVIDGLFCYINYIKPPKSRYENKKRWIEDKGLYDIKLNEVSKCIIVALMTMDRSTGSFFSKLINHDYGHITYKEKLDYLWAVKEQLNNIEIAACKEFLVFNSKNFNESEDFDEADEALLKNDFQGILMDTIDLLMKNLEFEVNRARTEDEIKRNITEVIESTLREFFPYGGTFALPFPSCDYEKPLGPETIDMECDYSSLVNLLKDIIGELNINFTCCESPTMFLEPEEKEYMLRALERDLQSALFTWRGKATQAIMKKYEQEVDSILGLM